MWVKIYDFIKISHSTKDVFSTKYPKPTSTEIQTWMVNQIITVLLKKDIKIPIGKTFNFRTNLMVIPTRSKYQIKYF